MRNCASQSIEFVDYFYINPKRLKTFSYIYRFHALFGVME